MELLITIVGYAASICMVLGYLPQAITTIRTRDTEGIALPTFLLVGLGGIFFIIQGLMLDNMPLVITNVITSACSAIIFGIKIYNDKKGKK
jgi:MtN3 and saliva related transmembrane protein